MMGESAQPGDDHPGGEIDVRSNLIGHASPRLSEATTGPTTVGPMDSARWARRTTTCCERRSPSAPIPIYQQAIVDRPEWLVDLFTDLDDRGTLRPLRSGQIRRLVLDRVLSEDRTLEGPTVTLSGRLTDPRCGPFDVSLAGDRAFGNVYRQQSLLRRVRRPIMISPAPSTRSITAIRN